MTEKNRGEPPLFQVVSDLGQLNAFVDPVNTRLLRVLQRQDASVAQLQAATGEPEPVIAEHVASLCETGLVRRVDEPDADPSGPVYRAMARHFTIRPDPQLLGTLAVPVATAIVEAVGREIVASLTTWPEQRMNHEGRRAHLSPHRVMEFNDRLLELIGEYFGDVDHPIEENPEDPLMSFVGLWYRTPDRI